MTTPTPRSIRNSIDKALASLGLTKKIDEYKVLDLWPTVVGERIANVTIAERMYDGKLYIHVTRAPWRNELVFLKKEIKEKINAAMGGEIVSDIIFR